MASGAFVDPKALLLVTPLVSSTVTFWFAGDQDFFLGLFTEVAKDNKTSIAGGAGKNKTLSDAILPAYFAPFFYRGLPRVIGPLSVTTWASIGCTYFHRGLLQRTGSLWWYAGAAALATAHLAYTPLVAWRINSILEDEGKEGRTNVDILREWLRVNWARWWTTDVGAWACAIVAVAKMVTV